MANLNLPAPLTPLIGREREVAAVCERLLRADVRLVTLTGAGGIGKTRLSLQVARESAAHFRDGAAFVSLASIHDPGLVIPAIAKEIGPIGDWFVPLASSNISFTQILVDPITWIWTEAAETLSALKQAEQPRF
jgi:hypothetical protein